MADEPKARTSVEARFADLVPDPAWSFAHLTQADTNYATHCYHRYPAKFIPQLAAGLIEAHTRPGQVVLDPFMGSGTTLVEARRLGRPSIGVDINPVAHLIAEAKVQAIQPPQLEKAIRHLYNELALRAKPSLFSASLRTAEVSWPERLRYWFREDVLEGLHRIQEATQGLEPGFHPFFRCALSHILKSVSYWHDRSVKPTRRPAKVTPDPYEAFFRQVRRMARGNAWYWRLLCQQGTLETPASCYCTDARHLPLPDESVNLIVTSPPYVTSYEYADLHQLSALWFALTTDLRQFRSRFIGRSQVTATGPLMLHSERAERIVTTLSEKDSRKAQEVGQYFAEMYACFAEWQRVLRPGGQACVVIGNTHLLGVEIRNAQVFVEQLEELGFVLEEVILREVPGKVLPRTRDRATGRFARQREADYLAYPVEYVLRLRKGYEA